MLSRLAFLLRKPPVQDALRKQVARELLATVQAIEAELPPPGVEAPT